MFRPRLPPDLDLTGLWDALLAAAAVAYVLGFVVALQAALNEGAGRVLICGSLYLAGEVLAASSETWPT